MEREKLIRKWLDNELSASEQIEFENLEDYRELIKLGEASKNFLPPNYEISTQFERLEKTIGTPPSKGILWRPFLRVAAMIVLLLGIYFTYTFYADTNSVHTDIAQKETITLPDSSFVKLNAVSDLAYDASSWETSRALSLNGEAYFKVKKGKTFKVQTSNGTVSVLGTQFNVYSREDNFEVVCYEGSVAVKTDAGTVILEAGDRFRESVKIPRKSVGLYPLSPSWINNESTFRKALFKDVISEFERQYRVQVTINSNMENQLFTGAFSHDNLDIAVRSISLPFGLSYVKSGNEIILKSE